MNKIEIKGVIIGGAGERPGEKPLQKLSVSSILRSGAETHEERSVIYGDHYKDFGPALLALFAGKIPEVTTVEDATRLNLVICCLNKLSRYAVTFDSGGHLDSAHDLMVYAAMLQEMTQ